MNTSDDVLLKEVDEDLRHEKQLNFLKQYGPWLAGAAGALVLGVAGQQIWTGHEDAKRATAGAAYFDAVFEAPDDVAAAADALEQIQPNLAGSGYATLAEMRLGASRALADEPEAALAAYQAVIDDGSAPQRLRDFARLRAAYSQVDSAPDIASRLAGAITTEAFLDHAHEVEALAALALEDYETAFALLSELGASTKDPRLASRARLLAPVADAGRNGVSLEPETSETNDFINSLVDDLAVDDLLGSQDASAPDVPDASAAPEGGETGQTP